LFGLKRALESNRKLLYGVQKLVVETDAKYLEGMLNNPDMMPNATINRWIDQVTMYHFTLRHKPDISFGPDGLSQWPKQPRNAPQPHIDDDDDILNKPSDFEMADEHDERPLPIEDFVDTIDNRGGYFHGIATSIDDFGAELDYLDTLQIQEKAHLQNIVKETKSLSQKVYVQQLVNALVLPDESMELDPYNESRRSAMALQQDKKMPLLNKMLKNKSYRPQNLMEKQIKRLLRLQEKFILYKDKLYRRGRSFMSPTSSSWIPVDSTGIHWNPLEYLSKFGRENVNIPVESSGMEFLIECQLDSTSLQKESMPVDST